MLFVYVFTKNIRDRYLSKLKNTKVFCFVLFRSGGVLEQNQGINGICILLIADDFRYEYFELEARSQNEWNSDFKAPLYSIKNENQVKV